MNNVIVINPRGIKGDEEYLDGMVRALYNRDDLNVELYTNYYFEMDDRNIPYNCHRWFLKKSEKMNPSTKRNVFRIVEYVINYQTMINEIKKKQPDIVHIHWSVVSSLDIYFWKQIKKYCGKLIYTAHNVLPHINGDRYKSSYGKLYNCADKIIVHGNSIYKEFSEIFPQYINKVYISRHGKKKDSNSIIDYTDPEIVKYEGYLKKYKKIILCFGMIYYEKGMDRVIRFWKKSTSHNNSCLIIAGKIQPMYSELDELLDFINDKEDILFLNQYLSNNLLNFFLKKANLIILPYRHASMSGVMLTAAAAGIPVLCTNVGSLSEYMPADGGFVVDNNDEDLYSAIENVLMNYDNDKLLEMGKSFKDYINRKYSWDTIVNDIVENCY